VAIDDEVDRGIDRETRHRYFPEPSPTIARLIRPARVRRPGGEATAEIGVYEMAKSPDRSRMAQDRAQATILAILDVAQPIAVFDERLPARELTGPRTHVVLDADIGTEHLAAPTVMVAGNP